MAWFTTVRHIKPEACMTIVRELRAHGLVQGTDFDFKYCPAEYNNDGYEAVEPSRAEFYFYKEKWKTFFAIKYAC